MPTAMATATVISVAHARRGARSLFTEASCPGPPNQRATRTTAQASGFDSAKHSSSAPTR